MAGKKGFKYAIGVFWSKTTAQIARADHVEHMEEDDAATRALPEWVRLEYAHMLTQVGPSSSVHFTSLSSSSIPPLESFLQSFNPECSSKAGLHTRPILSVISELTPPVEKARVCLLDPRAEKEIAPEDAEQFDLFLFGGILGDDPPRDRTGELRKLGFEGRHLGPVQMTTDTAVAVTKIVVEDGVKLNEIPWSEFPTISFSKNESIEMPFRYIADDKGEPILPPGMKEHLKADLDRTIDDF